MTSAFLTLEFPLIEGKAAINLKSDWLGITNINIANTFTPNANGYNNEWKITGVENYPNAFVQVCNCYGEKVSESKGYIKSFDGTYKGYKQPQLNSH